ncbi:MAG: DUF2865 domain-containing protein [Hyphomicrobiaceae bacterium]
MAPMSDSAPAQAQNWKFPWETDERPQPRRRPRPPAQSGQPGFGTTYNNQRLPGGRSPICLRLEQRLAQEANRGSLARGRLPEIEQGIRVARRSVRRLERELDRRECYETFLFSKTLRRTRSCVRLDRQSRRASTELRDLSAQRQQILGSGDRSYQDDIIRELALNNCGRVYTRENRRRNPFSNFWQDEDSGDRGYRGNTFAGLPFATYRTLCVRLCDGYYFPVSFSTLPPYFNRDAQACQSRCAAPTELYFHQNPGQSVDGMVSQRTQLPYSELKSAFKYRKEYVPGCSCKASEYVAADASNQIAPAPSAGQPQQSPPSGRRGLSPVR